MAEIREVKIKLRDKKTTGGTIPGNAIYGEPFVNIFDGVLRFSGMTAGTYETSAQGGVFEVGSTLYNSFISNRLNVNNKFIVSGGTGLISTYGGVSGAGLNGKFLSGTTTGFVLGNISDIQGVTTRVQPGINTYTGGTPDFPTVNVVASPSFNNLTFSGTATGGNASFSNMSATTIYSAGTDLYSIFLTAGDVSGSTVSGGSNISVNNVGLDYTVNLVASPSIDSLTFSGAVTGPNAVITNITATTETILGSGLRLRNPANTFQYTVVPSAISANRNVTLPLLAGNDTFVTEAFGQALTNKTINATTNTITDDSTAAGDLFKSNGTKFTRFARGGGLQVLRVQSGGGDLEWANEDITRVQPGTNITTGGTANNPTVNLVASPSINSLTFSGTANGGNLYATNLSGGTIYSGGTDLYGIFQQIGADTNHTQVQNGTNIVTGGTASNPTVNLVASPSINNLTFSGTVTGPNAVITNITATTETILNSGLRLRNPANTFQYTVVPSAISANRSITLPLLAGNDTFVTEAFAQTLTNKIINATNNTITDTSAAAGDLFKHNGTKFVRFPKGGALQHLRVNATTTDLEWVSEDTTRVQAGVNIVTGGTANNPTINVVNSPVFTGLVSATGFTDSSLTAGRVTYAGTGGRLKDESGFEYDEVANLLKTAKIQIGTPGTIGTTTTIYGDLLVMGQGISGFTSELYIEDNLIELNYNPTASTVATSLGAGWSIQDGSGVSNTDVLWDIRGAATGLANRSFATNLNDIRIRETGTISAPNGVRVIAEFDVIDGGSY